MFEGIFPKKHAAAEKKEAEGAVRGPIRVCAESFGLLDFEDRHFLDTFPENAEYVDYSGETYHLTRNGQIGIPRGYVLSRPSEHNKFSREYFNCSGMVVVGVDKTTGKNISILTHQDPSRILSGVRGTSQFQEDLTSVCRSLFLRAEAGSIDVVIFGGDYGIPEKQGIVNDAPGRQDKTRHDDYIDAVTLAADVAHSELGVEPVVVLGPRTVGHDAVSAFLDTQKRRLYLTRKGNPDVDKDFPASDVREHMDERLRKTYPDYYRSEL